MFSVLEPRDVRSDPCTRFGGVFTEEIVGHGPEVRVDMIQVHSVSRILETVFRNVPYPRRTVTKDKDLLRLGGSSE